jgi:hypothetical protein
MFLYLMPGTGGGQPTQCFRSRAAILRIISHPGPVALSGILFFSSQTMRVSGGDDAVQRRKHVSARHPHAHTRDDVRRNRLPSRRWPAYGRGRHL